MKRFTSLFFVSILFFSFLTFPSIPEAEAAFTPGEIVSTEAVIGNVSTTSNVFTDVTGLTANIVVNNVSNILIMASIQVNANESAVASYRLVFDGENFQGLTRQVSTATGNIVLVDLVEAKAAGTYAVKVQHNISNGMLFTVNASVHAVSLHNGNGAIPSNQSFVATETVSGIADEDIAGLTAEITLQRTSHVWVALTWAGQFSLANKQGNFTIEIDGMPLETRFRKWGSANQWGALSLISRTELRLPNGTHTVKGIWSGSVAGTLTGMNFSMVMIAGEADGKVAEFTINKNVDTTGTTTSTTMENINSLTFNYTTPADTHVMGFLSMDTESNINNRAVFFTININGTDDIEMKRDHTLAGSSIASVGQIVRTNATLPAGTGNMTGRWHTDAGTTITGNNIVLTSFVLFTEDTGLVFLTVFVHTGVSISVGGDLQVNGSVLAVTPEQVVNMSAATDFGYDFFRHELFYEISNIRNHTHFGNHVFTIGENVTHDSYALNIGAGINNVVINGGDGMSSYVMALASVGMIGIALALVMGGVMLSRRRET